MGGSSRGAGLTAEVQRRTLERRRAGAYPRPSEILAELAGEGRAAPWEEVASVLAQERDYFFIPTSVVEFLLRALTGTTVDRAVDPHAGGPFPLYAIVAEGVARRGDAYASSPSLIELGTALGRATGDNLSWHDEELSGAAELVVSFPPLAPVTTKRTYLGGVVVEDNAAGHTVAAASELLTPAGTAFVLVNRGVMLDRAASAAYPQLSSLGLHLHAAIDVAPKASRPYSAVPLSLLVVRRQPTDHVFLACLERETDLAALVENFRGSQNGATPELGRVVAAGSGVTIGQVRREERLERLGKKSGLKPQTLAEVLTEGTSVERLRRGEHWEPVENAVYIPSFANARAFHRLEDLASVHHSYFRALLDPANALAEYVAAYLNTPLGRAVREASASGSSMPSLSKAAVEKLTVFAPSPADQRANLDVRHKLEQLGVELAQLERRLVDHPRSHKSVQRDLTRLGHRDGFKAWLEELPFPIAIVAYGYTTEQRPERQANRLRRLYESTAALATTLLLSAYRSTDLYDDYKASWLGPTPRGPFRFDEGDFGTWVLLGQRMASTTRMLLDKPDTAKRVLAAFKLATDELPTALAHKNLWKVLDAARTVRNEQFGHGGAESDLHVERQVERYRELLRDFQSAIGSGFASTILVRPGAGRLRHGVMHFDEAVRLMGSNQQFTRIRFASATPLEADEMYLAEDVELVDDALLVVPFVRFAAAPRTSQDACYVFSKPAGGGKARYVSHHYEAEPDIELPEDGLTTVIKRLQTDAHAAAEASTDTTDSPKRRECRGG